MIMHNTTHTFRVEEKSTDMCDHCEHIYQFRSYDAMIGTAFIRKDGSVRVMITTPYIDYSRTTNKHISLMLGWLAYYFAYRVIDTGNEWHDIQRHALSIKDIRKAHFKSQRCGTKEKLANIEIY